MKFDVLTIVYLVIILLYLIIGLKKGFFKTLTGLIKSVLAIVIAIFLARPLTSLVVGTGIGDGINGKIETWLLGKEGVFTSVVTADTKDAVIVQALGQLNIPSVFHSWLAKMIDQYVEVGTEGVTVAAALAPAITYYLFYAAVFIVLFIIGLIICAILNKIFEKLEEIPFVGGLNKLLGVVLNLAIGLLVICVISYGLTFLVSLDNGISKWLVETMALDNPEVKSISKFFYENNFLIKIIAFFQGLFTK